MNTDDPLKPAAPGRTGAASREAPAASDRETYFRKLVSKMRSLVKSRRDPSRLFHLEQEYEAARLKLINDGLAEERVQDLINLLTLEAIEETTREAIARESARTDLTIPELLLLKKAQEEARVWEREELLQEKEAIEPPCRAGKRRRRKSG